MPETELHYRLLKVLEEDPRLSQRQLSERLGISLGSTNYALKALLERGWIKAQNFRRSNNKIGYLYKLTPHGISEKARLAYHFLQRKRAEHEALWHEIEELQNDVAVGPTRDVGRTRGPQARESGSTRESGTNSGNKPE